jgi:hypothetical protein
MKFHLAKHRLRRHTRSCAGTKSVKLILLQSALALTFLASGRFVLSEPPQENVFTAVAALVDYGSGVIIQPKKRDTIFAQLLLNANQTVTITLQYDPAFAGQVVIVEPLDGGIATVPEEGAMIDQDGKVSFQFQAADVPGLSRISIHQYEDGDLLQFWIIDTANPANNPPTILGN